VDRDDYRRTRSVEATPAGLADGEARLRVDAFGLTANNVTYAAAGDLVGYWTFFPHPTSATTSTGARPGLGIHRRGRVVRGRRRRG